MKKLSIIPLLFIAISTFGQEIGSVKSWVRLYEKSSDVGILGQNFGRSLHHLGDIDGNGYKDFVSSINEFGDNEEGAICIVLMKDEESVLKTVHIANGISGLPENTYNGNALFGGNLDVIKDLDGDGINELLASDSRNDQIFILFIDQNGEVKQYTRIGEGTNGFDVSFNSDADFGNSLMTLGDVDRDGIEDIAVCSLVLQEQDVQV